jgi:hypothetical protein
MRALIVALVLVPACTAKDANSDEIEYTRKEIAKLEQDLAKKDETGTILGCVTIEVSLARLPADLAAKAKTLCYVEMPRLVLRNAVADVKTKTAEHPDMGSINCMQLMASDAFKAMAKQPTQDAELKQLVDEYTKLCPDAVAKLRAAKS